MCAEPAAVLVQDCGCELRGSSHPVMRCSWFLPLCAMALCHCVGLKANDASRSDSGASDGGRDVSTESLGDRGEPEADHADSSADRELSFDSSGVEDAANDSSTSDNDAAGD